MADVLIVEDIPDTTKMLRMVSGDTFPDWQIDVAKNVAEARRFLDARKAHNNPLSLRYPRFQVAGFSGRRSYSLRSHSGSDAHCKDCAYNCLCRGPGHPAPC